MRLIVNDFTNEQKAAVAKLFSTSDSGAGEPLVIPAANFLAAVAKGKEVVARKSVRAPDEHRVGTH